MTATSPRLAVFEKMLAAGSRDAFVWYARAMELRSLGRLDDAWQAHCDVEREFPDYVANYLMAGQVARELQRDEDARAVWMRGIAVAERQGEAHALSELRSAVGALP